MSQGPKRSLTDDDLKELAETPLIITIVGHTDTGKTSIVRTLSEDVAFGEVSPVPSTTRKAAGQSYKLGVRDLMSIYDTPGFEQAGRILKECEPLDRGSGDPLDKIRALLAGPEYDFERSVLDQVVKSDVLLYVTNIAIEPQREAVHELAILTRAGKPVIPVLNFLSGGSHRLEWEEFFLRNGHPLVSSYDAHVRVPSYEERLFRLIADMLDRKPVKRLAFEYWAGVKAKRMADARAASAGVIAELLLDAAAYHAISTGVSRDRRKVELERLVIEFKASLRDREKDAHNQILRRYAHRDGLVDTDRKAKSQDSQVAEEAFVQNTEDDLFGSGVAKRLRLGVISGASAGATSALVIDAVFHGMTFGAAALTGGLIGAAIGALAGGFYNARYDEKNATLTVKSTRGTLRALYWRGLGAATACHFRGHAVEPYLGINLADGLLPSIGGVTVRTAKSRTEDDILDTVEMVVNKVGPVNSTRLHAQCADGSRRKAAYQDLHRNVRDRIESLLKSLEEGFEKELRSRA